MKQFDLVRASFLLVAGVITAHVLIVAVAVGMCMYQIEAIVEGKFHCDAENKLASLLAEALAAALAFAGGQISRGKSDTKDDRAGGPPTP